MRRRPDATLVVTGALLEVMPPPLQGEPPASGLPAACRTGAALTAAAGDYLGLAGISGPSPPRQAARPAAPAAEARCRDPGVGCLAVRHLPRPPARAAGWRPRGGGGGGGGAGGGGGGRGAGAAGRGARGGGALPRARAWPASRCRGWPGTFPARACWPPRRA